MIVGSAPSLVDAAGATCPSMFLQVQPLDDAASPSRGYQTSELVVVMATVVSKLIDEDARDNVTKFCADASGHLRTELPRIGQYLSDCSRGVALSMVYIDRLGMRLSPLNVHRLLITAVCVASKFLDDSFCELVLRAARRDSLEELNRLGGGFLFSLADPLLHVSPSEYYRYYAGVEAAERDASKPDRRVIPPSGVAPNRVLVLVLVGDDTPLPLYGSGARRRCPGQVTVVVALSPKISARLWPISEPRPRPRHPRGRPAAFVRASKSPPSSSSSSDSPKMASFVAALVDRLSAPTSPTSSYKPGSSSSRKARFMPAAALPP